MLVLIIKAKNYSRVIFLLVSNENVNIMNGRDEVGGRDEKIFTHFHPDEAIPGR